MHLALSSGALVSLEFSPPGSPMREHYHSHFVDEETEVRRARMTCSVLAQLRKDKSEV